MKQGTFNDLGYKANFVVSVSSPVSVSTYQRYDFDWQRQETKPNELNLNTSLPDDLIIEVFPQAGDPWIGQFQMDASGVTGLFGTPSPDILCVVANGQGYWVPILQPDSYEEIHCIPIKHVFAIPENHLMVFGSFTKLEAYGPNGWLWKTERLSWDGLEILETNGTQIRGLAWDSPADKQVEFVVDARSGAHRGGSSPKSSMGEVR